MAIGQPLYVVRDRWLISVPITTASLSLISTDCCLMGFSFNETTGSAGATFDLWNGHDTGGVLGMSFSLAQAECIGAGLPDHGWPFSSGIYLSVLSGSIKGSIVVGKLDPVY